MLRESAIKSFPDVAALRDVPRDLLSWAKFHQGVLEGLQNDAATTRTGENLPFAQNDIPRISIASDPQNTSHTTNASAGREVAGEDFPAFQFVSIGAPDLTKRSRKSSGDGRAGEDQLHEVTVAGPPGPGSHRAVDLRPAQILDLTYLCRFLSVRSVHGHESSFRSVLNDATQIHPTALPSHC